MSAASMTVKRVAWTLQLADRTDGQLAGMLDYAPGTVRDALDHLEHHEYARRAANGRWGLTPLGYLAADQWQAEQIDSHRMALMATCHREGHTWGAIGRALGLTRQGARQAWERAGGHVAQEVST